MVSADNKWGYTARIVYDCNAIVSVGSILILYSVLRLLYTR